MEATELVVATETSDDCELCDDCMRCRRTDHRGRVAHMLCRCTPGEGIFG
jgi:hypothetical protein